MPPLLEVLDELGRAHRRVARVGGRAVQLDLLDLEERLHRVAHVLSREETAWLGLGLGVVMLGLGVVMLGLGLR